MCSRGPRSGWGNVCIRDCCPCCSLPPPPCPSPWCAQALVALDMDWGLQLVNCVAMDLLLPPGALGLQPQVDAAAVAAVGPAAGLGTGWVHL